MHVVPSITALSGPVVPFTSTRIARVIHNALAVIIAKVSLDLVTRNALVVEEIPFAAVADTLGTLVRLTRVSIVLFRGILFAS